jgi:nicotinamidase-related amidase
MPKTPVLLVIDAQVGFRDEVFWGKPANPDYLANINLLVAHWRSENWPIVMVKHNSVIPDSPLNPSSKGNELEPSLEGVRDLVIQKSVNSAFYGTPDLHLWLTKRNFRELVICGVTTNFCCETTARMAGNLGYRVTFAIDATTAFDLPTKSGETIPGDLVMKMTAANLDGKFATVLNSAEIIK